MSKKNRDKRERNKQIKAQLINSAKPENVQLAACLADGIIYVTDKYEKLMFLIFVNLPKKIKKIFKKHLTNI